MNKDSGSPKGFTNLISESSSIQVLTGPRNPTPLLPKSRSASQKTNKRKRILEFRRGKVLKTKSRKEWTAEILKKLQAARK